MASSVIRQLSDEDLEAVHHMIRRDAKTDLEIADDVERRLGREIGRTDHAKVMVISRYRKGKAYRAWLERYNRRWVELETAVRLQQQRLEVVSNLVKDSTGEGFDDMAKSIQGRLLALAATASDEELKDAAEAKGWVATSLRLVREVMQDRWRKQCEELKAELRRMIEEPKGKAVSTADVVRRVDEIMGLTG